MAKMFYTLDEAAGQLGVSEDRVKEMVQNGELQQFRDRDKLMFKRDQVDNLAGNQGAAAGGEQAAGASEAAGQDVQPSDSRAAGAGSAAGQADSAATAIPLADTGTGASPAPAGPGSSEQNRADESGVDVVKSDEVGGEAEPAAQTQTSSGQTSADSGEMSLEAAGSGSGLLDLTRESDDTSLGAELMDEIYPSEDEQKQGQNQGQGQAGDTGGGGSGAGQSTAGHSTAGQTAGSAVMEGAGGSVAGAGTMEAAEPTGETRAAPVQYDTEGSDPVGAGLGTGFLIGATIALALGLLVAVAGIAGVGIGLIDMMTASPMQFGLWIAGLLVLCVIFALIGMAIGNASASPGRRGR